MSPTRYTNGGSRMFPGDQEPQGVHRLAAAVCETCPEGDRRPVEFLVTGPEVWRFVIVGRTRVFLCARCMAALAPDLSP